MDDCYSYFLIQNSTHLRRNGSNKGNSGKNSYEVLQKGPLFSGPQFSGLGNLRILTNLPRSAVSIAEY